MALHILKQGTPTWGNILGQSVGHGINALTKTKLERMKENEDIKLFTSLGVDPTEARLINRLPEKQRAEALAKTLEYLQKEEQSEQVSSRGQAEEPAAAMTRAPQQGSSLSNILGGQSNQGQPNAVGGTAGGISMDLLPEPLRQALEEARNPRKQEQAAQQNVQYEPEQQNVQPGTNLEQQKAPKTTGKHDRLIAALRAGNAKDELAQEKANTTKQAAIDRQNAPFNKGLTAGVVNAEKAIDILSNMEQLLDTGKVSSGLYGKVPSILQNSESQQFEANADALAQQLAGQSGVAGAFKIRFAQNLKPKLTDKEQTQKDRIQFLKKEAEKVLRKAQLRDDLIEENGGFQPPNLESLINKRSKELEKSGKSQDTFQAKPNPALYKGQTITNEETGEEEMSDGKQWVRV